MTQQAITAADVKAIRKQAGLDQAPFGRALGTSEKTIRNWERGAVIPDTAQQLLRAVRAALIGGEAMAQWARDCRAQLSTEGEG